MTQQTPIKAPIPAGTGRGAGSKCNKIGNNSISNKSNIYNSSDPEYSIKNINGWSDITPIMERTVEQALSLCLLLYPKATIEAALETRIEPSLDREVVSFWQAVKPRFQEILSLGEPEATQLIYSMMGYPFFFRCDRAYETLERPGDPIILTRDLIAIRSQRKSTIYIQERKLVNMVFDGWVEL